MDSKKILIIRFSALGDVAMTVPVVHDLAVQYPDLDITMLSRPMCEPMFVLLPDNVHFVAADLKGRHKGIGGLNRLLREIQYKDFDYVADFHDVLRTQWLRFRFALAGKKVARIDKGRKGKRRLTRQKNKILAQQATSFERYAKVLERLGFPVKVDFKGLDYRRFEEVPHKPGEHWVGIAPFAKHEAKAYPLEMMEEVVEMLSKKVNVLLFGGGFEEKQVLSDMCYRHENTYIAHSEFDLAGEIAMMQQLDVMLTMDSANMHLASLVGTPVVSVWGGTHPYAGFLGWHQKDTDCVQLDMPCRPCSVYGNKPCLRGDYACMRGITPEMIVKKVSKYFE